MKPGKPGFDGERSRGLGGKTQLWNAVALRFSERDFKGRSHDGAGEDWPFGYAEMKPYYDRIERKWECVAIWIIWKICPMAFFFRRCR